MKTLRERCAGITFLVVDVDGVLTRGGIVHGTGGLELKSFHVRDGLGLSLWTRRQSESVDRGPAESRQSAIGNRQSQTRRAAILTGRSSPVVDLRAAEVGIDLVVQGACDKLAAYHDLLRRAAVDPAQVCYVGDDLPDLAPMRQSGLAVAVADACPEVRAGAHFVTRRGGGQGAVREAVELVLRCQGFWEG